MTRRELIDKFKKWEVRWHKILCPVEFTYSKLSRMDRFRIWLSKTPEIQAGEYFSSFSLSELPKSRRAQQLIREIKLEERIQHLEENIENLGIQLQKERDDKQRKWNVLSERVASLQAQKKTPKRTTK